MSERRRAVLEAIAYGEGATASDRLRALELLRGEREQVAADVFGPLLEMSDDELDAELRRIREIDEATIVAPAPLHERLASSERASEDMKAARKRHDATDRRPRRKTADHAAAAPSSPEATDEGPRVELAPPGLSPEVLDRPWEAARERRRGYADRDVVRRTH